MSYRQVTFTAEAKADLARLAQRDRRLVVSALSVAKQVAVGRIDPTPLRAFGKTGELGDCSKVYFGVDADDDTHRIVFREVDGRIDVLEVVVIEDRTEDLPYLLAGLRLDRLDGAIRVADAKRQVARTRAKLAQRPDQDTK